MAIAISVRKDTIAFRYGTECAIDVQLVRIHERMDVGAALISDHARDTKNDIDICWLLCTIHLPLTSLKMN